MPRTKSIRIQMPDGTTRETSGESVEITDSKEFWNEYQLSDGSRVRVKPVVSTVLRTDEFDPVGNPLYQVSCATVVFVEASDTVKRKSV